jgi:glycosyltransferase involved in cell wall biosynthesis
MKVAGFSFVRNAVRYDYPIVEAITSILPICDEFVVAVGRSDDETLERIRAIDSPKLRILETVWDDTLREGGQVLAAETNKALAALAPDTDWAFYIQGDEVVHEDDLPRIRAAMAQYLPDARVEGLLFRYRHFYGSYRYVGDSRRWYRREVRIVRHTGQVVSWKDAQGFRTREGRKLRVRPIDAAIHHYGWVRPPDVQRQRLDHFGALYHDDAFRVRHAERFLAFDYGSIDSLAPFQGTHPAVMQPRIARMSWAFDFDLRRKRLPLRYRLLHLVERLTGWMPFEYRNYQLLR